MAFAELPLLLVEIELGFELEHLIDTLFEAVAFLLIFFILSEASFIFII